MKLEERAANYNKTFHDNEPSWCVVDSKGRWLNATWMLGQNYKGSGFYGSYPPTLLNRVMELFPDKHSVMHLFSGSLPPSPHYIRIDINKELKPDIVANAEDIPVTGFDLVIADPPYSPTDADKYGVSYPNKRLVLHSIWNAVIPTGHLVWLDTSLPMYTKKEWKHVGNITIIRSTNHRIRLAAIFEVVK